MFPERERPRFEPLAKFLLSHHHRPEECRHVYAAWNGFASPLRRNRAMSSCASGTHAIFWTVEAIDERTALAQLPPYVAERTAASEVRAVAIP